MALTKICKTFDFDAAHRLDFLPPEHKCHRMHGHTYRVDVMLAGHPDHNGMMIDYADIAARLLSVIELVDHRVLNDVPGLQCPTTEVVAAWFAQELSAVDWGSACWLDAVRVYESSTTWAEVRAADVHEHGHTE